MDSLALILAALAAGAATGGQAIAGDALKDSYAGLKALIKRKFAGKPKAEMVLTEHESNPKIWEAPLKEALVQEHIDQDQQIMEAAQRVMQLVQPRQAAKGRYNVQITGDVHGFAQGDGQNVTMHFGGEPKEKK
ncbi:hypothetical protein KSF_088480 [Reticulibacter mediterranei]|uniref:Uncharacterized protein n=1 Tax=Reticulibacter mediterranei TaxID=2778369 RepID=A0A8J3N7S8_9CHLR|nr:hypothetical protein [Reticulibacter mediterranei]GHO98800.1 hypothetical protein KSF_088480 [Reticulibacter mediterranei]